MKKPPPTRRRSLLLGRFLALRELDPPADRIRHSVDEDDVHAGTIQLTELRNGADERIMRDIEVVTLVIVAEDAKRCFGLRAAFFTTTLVTADGQCVQQSLFGALLCLPPQRTLFSRREDLIARQAKDVVSHSCSPRNLMYTPC